MSKIQSESITAAFSYLFAETFIFMRVLCICSFRFVDFPMVSAKGEIFTGVRLRICLVEIFFFHQTSAAYPGIYSTNNIIYFDLLTATFSANTAFYVWIVCIRWSLGGYSRNFSFYAKIVPVIFVSLSGSPCFVDQVVANKFTSHPLFTHLYWLAVV